MLTLTLLSNAGILLTLDHTQLMIDGLYTAQDAPFSDVPPHLLAPLTPDYLAFTHTHHDHLDQAQLTAHLAKHSARGLVLPPRVHLYPVEVPTTVMKGTAGTVPLPPFTLRWGRTPHLENARPEHHSFLVEGAGKSILVTGDARPSTQLAQLGGGTHLTALVTTPLFLQTPEGQAQVLDQLRPEQVFLYHLPRPEDDRWGLLTMARRQAQRWADRLPVLPLDQPGVAITL